MGDGDRCRQSSDAEQCLAAITLQVNPYVERRGSAWAQILHMSSRYERRGHGRRLFREVERLVAASRAIDVLVCYPVGREAACFWRSCGFARAPGAEASLLPPEDLVPAGKCGGRLIPEVEGRSGAELPRWEKRVASTL